MEVMIALKIDPFCKKILQHYLQMKISLFHWPEGSHDQADKNIFALQIVKPAYLRTCPLYIYSYSVQSKPMRE